MKGTEREMTVVSQQQRGHMPGPKGTGIQLPLNLHLDGSFLLTSGLTLKAVVSIFLCLFLAEAMPYPPVYFFNDESSKALGSYFGSLDHPKEDMHTRIKNMVGKMACGGLGWSAAISELCVFPAARLLL